MYFASEGTPTVVNDEEYYFVPTTWLKGWVTGIKPEPPTEGKDDEKKRTQAM